jgi:hypothetical protein
MIRLALRCAALRCAVRRFAGVCLLRSEALDQCAAAARRAQMTERLPSALEDDFLVSKSAGAELCS